MKNQLQVLCMAFNGDYVVEKPVFDTTEQAWEYADNLGSKWFFYPFVFIISGIRIKDTPPILEFLKHRNINRVQKIFKALSEREEMERANVERFTQALIETEGV